MSKKNEIFAVGALFVLLAAQGASAIVSKSPTCDEFSHHVASGYSYIVTGDFRMNPASPPLPRMLSALPLLFLKARAPLDHVSWARGDSPEFARQFFYVYNKHADLFIVWARTPILIVSVLFALGVFLWSRKLFGPVAAFGALTLYCFSPDILAHSSLATSDIAVAFFFFLTHVSFWFYLKNTGASSLAATGIFAGLSFLCKFSSVLLFPSLFLVAWAAGKNRAVRLKAWLSMMAICVTTVWTGYFFEMKPLLKNTPDPAKKMAVYEKVGKDALVGFAQNAPVPLSTFSSALASMSFTRARGTNAYLLGRWSRDGWWYYYLVALLIKNTIPMVVLTVLFLCGAKGFAADRLTKAVLLVPPTLFFLATLGDRAQAGIRYFLPVYPFLFIWAGAAVSYLWKAGKTLRLLALFLLAWHAGEALWVRPHYLAYFNEWAGGPSGGYKWLRDSNIDWGQDLKMLGQYVRQKGYPEVVLQSISPADPAYYGIPYRRFGEDELLAPRKTVYAIGAHSLDGVRWTKAVRPDKIIGYSIFLYDFR